MLLAKLLIKVKYMLNLNLIIHYGYLSIISSTIPINSVSHDVIKIFSSDKSVVIEIGFGEHVLDFLL